MGRLQKDHKYLIIVILVGFLNGLVFVLLMPPWQHYDEPNHFEYAWLIAHHGHLPQVGEYDQEMRRNTAISMVEHNFFKGMGFSPDLNATDQPIWIGQYSQLGDPPLYYLLGSLPLHLPVESVTIQLYLVRLVSLGLYLASLFAAWGIMTEITSVGNPLRWLVPLTMALLPGISDVMTGVNNVVAATVFFSFCLWGCVRLLVRGISIVNFLWAAAAAGLCLLTSAIAYIALPIFIFSSLLALFRGKWRAIAFGVLCLIGLSGAALVLRGGDAAFWYRSTLQSMPLRALDNRAIIGRHTFQVDTSGEVWPKWLVPSFQSIGKDLPQGTYTFGSWMWASQPMLVQAPIIGTGSTLTSNPVRLTKNPSFHAFLVTISKDGLRTWVSLSPKAEQGQDGFVYYDGLVLAGGEYPLNQPPAYSDTNGEGGTWGGKYFRNLIRNGSAEEAGLRFRTNVDRIGAKLLPDNTMPSLLITYLMDWTGAGWHYFDVGRRLLRTFWGTFGWGHVPLLAENAYVVMGFITIVAIAGCLVRLTLSVLKKGLFPLPRRFTWDILVLFVLVLVLAWGSTFMRGASYLASVVFYLPVARYAFPAIVPTSLLLAGGWIFILSLIFAITKRWNKRPPAPAIWIYCLSLLIIDLYALWSIYLYYFGVA